MDDEGLVTTMGSKQPQPAPPQPIRVAIIGDHPHSESFGWIDFVNGGYETIQVIGTEKPMVKVNLDSGEACYAGIEHLRKIGRPTSPPPPRRS